MKLSRYLIASELNDYKPWITTSPALGLFCLVIWGLRVIVPASITLAASAIDANDLMSKINLERTQRFIQPVTTNSKLITAAGGKASDMLTRSYFAHVDPDGNYVWPRIQAAGYKPYMTLGENLAMDFNSADGVVSAWMNSPTHRENIVNAKFQDQGVASVSGLYEPGHNTTLVVSLFGALYKSQTPSPAPAPTPAPKPAPPPAPQPAPVIKNPPTSVSKLKISDDIKVSQTSLSGHILINVDVIITGGPTLVTALLNTQSISLIAGSTAGQYVGSFNFDPTEDLRDATLTVQARDKDANKASLEYPVNIESPAVTGTNTMPVSSESQIIKILRIVFGVFATIYLGFLVIDAIIIHRAKIKRIGLNANPHLLIFALLIAVTVFSSWF